MVKQEIQGNTATKKKSTVTIHVEGLLPEDRPASQGTPAPPVGRVNATEAARPLCHPLTIVVASDEIVKDSKTAALREYIVRHGESMLS